MAINKVIYGGDTLIDLTSDSVTPPKLKIGATAHSANGSIIDGELAGVYYGTAQPSSTDTKVWIDPSGDNINIKYQIYNSVTDLGLTSGSATITGAYSALGDNEMLICDSDDFSGTQTPSMGLVCITKGVSIARGSILFYGKTDAVGDYRMFLSATSNAPDGVWHCLDNNGLLLKTTSTSGTATANTRLELTVSWGLPTGATVQAYWIQTVSGSSNTDSITRCDFISSTKIRAMSTVGQNVTVGVGCLYTKTFTVS